MSYNSVNRVSALQNQFKRESIRRSNIRNMLNYYMPYIYNAYKPEEVETVLDIADVDL